jgi:excisionase family DNA binding protein
VLARPRGRVVKASPGGRIPGHLPPAADDARAAPALVPEDFLTVDEVAAIMRRSPRTVRRWIAHGDLPVVRIRRTKCVPVRALAPTRAASPDGEESTE